jgi:hypothetical protein
MKSKTSEPAPDLDKQLKRLVKKSVEGCTASNEAWSRIKNTIQMNRQPAMTPKETTPSLSLSE